MKIEEFDYSVDILQSLLWQYNKAPNLESIITAKQNWYNLNQTEFWTDWYNNVFNLLTADAFGLAVWSYILDVPLFIATNPDPPSKPIFGFNEIPSINSNVNFENGNYSNINGVIVLTEEEQRLILRLKYYKLVSRGAIPEINIFLNELFKTSGTVYSGRAWVLDNLDMTMTYVFDFALPDIMLLVLKNYDILPRPAGVELIYDIRG